MPQRFYLDTENLNQQFEKIDINLYQMLDFAYLHEDTVNTIESLMSDWAKENLNSYQSIVEDWEKMSEDDKEYFDDIDEYMMSEMGRWWMQDFNNLSDEDKKMIILRYRLTIAICLHSNTYGEELMQEIEQAWQYEMVG